MAFDIYCYRYLWELQIKKKHNKDSESPMRECLLMLYIHTCTCRPISMNITQCLIQTCVHIQYIHAFVSIKRITTGAQKILSINSNVFSCVCICCVCICCVHCVHDKVEH